MDYWDVSDHLTEINYANKIFYIVSIWQTLQFTIPHSALANIQITYRSDSTFPSGDTWLRTDPQAGHYRTVISLYLPLTVSVNDLPGIFPDTGTNTQNWQSFGCFGDLYPLVYGWKFILCFHLYIVSPNTFYTSIFVDLLLVSRFYRYIQKYVFVFRNGFFCRIRQGLEIGIVERIKLDLEWTIKP